MDEIVIYLERSLHKSRNVPNWKWTEISKIVQII